MIITFRVQCSPNTPLLHIAIVRTWNYDRTFDLEIDKAFHSAMPVSNKITDDSAASLKHPLVFVVLRCSTAIGRIRFTGVACAQPRGLEQTSSSCLYPLQLWFLSYSYVVLHDVTAQAFNPSSKPPALRRDLCCPVRMIGTWRARQSSKMN